MTRTKLIQSKQTQPTIEGEGATIDGYRGQPAPSSFTQPVGEQAGAAFPTVEQALYVLLLVAALGLRFADLGTLKPLLPLEAAQAWPAWLAAVGRSAEAASLPHSSLLYTAQRFLLWLTDGGNDAWVRAVPALVGSLVVLLPWGLRRGIGRVAALLLALFLALDPWLISFSRTGDGAILSVSGALLLIVAWLNWGNLSVDQRRWLAVAAGLTLISGPLIWLLLPVLVAVVLLFPATLAADRNERLRLAGLAALGAVAGATGWLAYWEGVGVLSTSVGVAVTYLAGDGAGYPLAWPFLRLLVDQPLLWSVGLPALAWIGLQRAQGKLQRGWKWLLIGWTLYGLLLVLLPGRNPATLLLLALPLSIVTAQVGAVLLHFCLDEIDWQDGTLIAVALGVLLVTSFFWTAYATRAPETNAQFLLFYLLLPLLVAFFIWWSGTRTTLQVTLLLTMGALLLALVSSSWMMNLRPALPRLGDLHATVGRAGVHLLTEDVARLSAIRAGAPEKGAVWIGVDDERVRPLLGWYLRPVDDVRFAPADPAAVTDLDFVVTDVGDQPTLPADTVGSDYAVVSTWQPTELTGLLPWLRWLFYRDAIVPPSTESVILWVRSD